MAGGVRMRVARRPTARMPPCRPCARRPRAAYHHNCSGPTGAQNGRGRPQAAARIGGARLRLRAEAPAAVGRRLRVGIDYKMRAHSRPVDAGRVGRRLRVGIDYNHGPILPPERGAAPAPRSIGIDCNSKTVSAALKLVVLAVHTALKLVVLAVHTALKLVVLALYSALKRVAVDAYILKQACLSHGIGKRKDRRRDAAVKNEQA